VKDSLNPRSGSRAAGQPLFAHIGHFRLNERRLSGLSSSALNVREGGKGRRYRARLICLSYIVT
jgi:hypothetical protein